MKCLNILLFDRISVFSLSALLFVFIWWIFILLCGIGKTYTKSVRRALNKRHSHFDTQRHVTSNVKVSLVSKILFWSRAKLKHDVVFYLVYLTEEFERNCMQSTFTALKETKRSTLPPIICRRYCWMYFIITILFCEWIGMTVLKECEKGWRLKF